MIDIPGYPPFPLPWLVVGGIVFLAAAVLYGLVGSGGGDKRRRRHARSVAEQRAASERWGTRRDARVLITDKKAWDPRRVRLGNLGKYELANPPLRSKMVVAPTGAGKTPRVVVPDVLMHRGPVVVTSTKGDVLALTHHHRLRSGPVWVFDPFQSTGRSARWSPLPEIHDWASAMDAATWIQESSKVDGSRMEDAAFWDGQARRLLAPLLFVGARRGWTMAEIAAVVAEGESADARVQSALVQLEEPLALTWWRGYCALPDRTRGSVVATAMNVLEAWMHPRVQDVVGVRSGEQRPDIINFDELLDTDGTLYLVCPASDQGQFSAIFETMINALMVVVERRYHASGARPLGSPLLLALDEAANIAPLRKLDQIASEKAGQGVIVVSVWQSESQVAKIYGPERARTILANHTAKVFLAGIQDRETLQGLSDLIGDTFIEQHSRQRGTTGGYGPGGRNSSTTTNTIAVKVAPPELLREMSQSEAIVITSNIKPLRVRIPGWFEDRRLRARVAPEVAAQFDNEFKKGRSDGARRRLALR